MKVNTPDPLHPCGWGGAGYTRLIEPHTGRNVCMMLVCHAVYSYITLKLEVKIPQNMRNFLCYHTNNSVMLK